MIPDPTRTHIEARIAELTEQLANPDLNAAHRKAIWQMRLGWKDQLESYLLEHPVNDTLDLMYKTMQSMAIKEVERLARKIMKANPEITGFCNAMGSTSFYETCPETEEEGAKTHEPIGDYDARVKEMDDFIRKWDRELRISGHPMKLKSHDGELLTDW
jgi:hypothetical protein